MTTSAVRLRLAGELGMSIVRSLTLPVFGAKPHNFVKFRIVGEGADRALPRLWHRIGLHHSSQRIDLALQGRHAMIQFGGGHCDSTANHSSAPYYRDYGDVRIAIFAFRTPGGSETVLLLELHMSRSVRKRRHGITFNLRFGAVNKWFPVLAPLRPSPARWLPAPKRNRAHHSGVYR